VPAQLIEVAKKATTPPSEPFQAEQVSAVPLGTESALYSGIRIKITFCEPMLELSMSP
jgi:hypothetical protein